VLSLRAIEKRFDRVTALAGVDLDLAAGRIHGILGENGAGKSTLMNVAAGLVLPDAGSIVIGGAAEPSLTPRRAAELGVRMVHQHFKLVPSLTVVENVLLARPGGLVLDRRRAAREIVETARRLDLAVRPDARVLHLSVGERQRVELVRALAGGGARVLILDEPTSCLSPPEIGPLFEALRALRDGGLAVAFIGHKLREVLSLCDGLTVLSRGRVVATREDARSASPSELAELMIGAGAAGEAASGAAPAARPAGPPVLVARDLAARDDAGTERLRAATFTVREGEIYAITGVEGNGQRELGEVVAGLRAPSRGEAVVGSRRVSGLGRGSARDSGVAFVPDDRRERGLVLDLTVEENLALSRRAAGRLKRLGPFLARGALAAHARGAVRAFDVRSPGTDVAAGALSGGNQQKLVLAREILDEPVLLVAVNPTSGLDWGATRAVHGHLLERKKSKGAATLLITTDLDEAIAIGDRIGVLFGGVLLEAEPGAGRDVIGQLMTTGAR